MRLRTLGYAIANFEYRLLRETVTLADIVADNKDIVRWLRANAQQYGIHSHNIGLWGQSAGAHLLLMAGLTNDDDFTGDARLSHISADVDYIVSDYGPTDLVALFQPIVSGEQTPRMMADKHVKYMFESSLADDREGFVNGLAELSPVSYVDANDPPVLLVHGDADTAVDAEQSRILERALKEAGTEHEVLFVVNADHIFNGATPEQVEDIVETSIAFISRNTR